jgi:hypothetical protein
MTVTPEDLRRQLKFTREEWTNDDWEFAEAILQSADVACRSIAGPTSVQIAEEADDELKLAAFDQAVLAYAKLMFANPERVMQRRQGSDYSVSFADSSLAAIGLKEVEAILSGHFSLGRANAGWIANDIRFDSWIRL